MVKGAGKIVASCFYSPLSTMTQDITQYNIAQYVEGIRSGERSWIGQAITLVESSLPADQEVAAQLLDELMPHTGGAYRVGITGVPGAGKSTLINVLGLLLIEKGPKVGVLAVDPSSPISGGSIMGDKTRMSSLSQSEHAFVRPSPTHGKLGDATRATREVLLILEAAGFDAVFVETVGVGQSESVVADMVDFFLLVLIPGAGDELQGIKRGVVEMADHIVVNKAWEHICEVEEVGGMALAIEQGIPKLRIEEAAARTQARIDTGQQPLIGVNKYRPSHPEATEILHIDNSQVRASQTEKLKQLRAERDEAACVAALEALRRGAGDRDGNREGKLAAGYATGSGVRAEDGNLLALSVNAARAGATVGEISDALEKAWGRHVAEIRMISGVYRSEAHGDKEVDEVRHRVEAFEQATGRRPRILVAKVGQDGHDRGQKVVATAYADLGFDVDIGPLFQTPSEVAQQAVENDVHIVGVSSLAGAHLTLVPELKSALEAQGRGDIVIVVGGVIPPRDVEDLIAAGARAVFPPGSAIAEAAGELLDILVRQDGEGGGEDSG